MVHALVFPFIYADYVAAPAPAKESPRLTQVDLDYVRTDNRIGDGRGKGTTRGRGISQSYSVFGV